MYHTLEEFYKDYENERGETQKILNALTDASLSQAVTDGHRTIGRIAWHLITTYPEMTSYSGIITTAVKKDDPIPSSAAKIAQTYQQASQEMLDFIRGNWQDSELKVEKEFYGEKWSIGLMLAILIKHEIHHRAQLTILMRQAGLKVPGTYGPSKEEWTNYGQNPPEV